jgi:multidrug resistance efflux pump
MPEIFPVEMMRNSSMQYLHDIKASSQVIYITILLFILSVLVASAFIYVEVTVNSNGIIRPVAEKAEIKTLYGGTIDSIICHDGEFIRSGSPLIYLQSNLIESKLKLIAFKQEQKQIEIQDLEMLCQARPNFSFLEEVLQSPLYRKQFNEFLSVIQDNAISLAKFRRDLAIRQQLYADGKIVALQEVEDKQFELSKTTALNETAIARQRNKWQSDITEKKMELLQLLADEEQLKMEKSFTVIRATVSGSVQEFNGRYKGDFLQAGEIVGIISPDCTLVANCYVTPVDIGLIKTGMSVNFQLDAFNYNSWGFIQGEVAEIGNDFVINDKQPVFLVKCRLKNTSLSLKNGYSRSLKKGMTFRARFIITRRSLWQLMYDKIDNWLNPLLNN